MDQDEAIKNLKEQGWTVILAGGYVYTRRRNGSHAARWDDAIEAWEALKNYEPKRK